PRGYVLLRYIVVLAEPEGAPAIVLQNLPDRRAFGRQSSAPARKALRRFGNAGAGIDVMIAAGHKRRARWRARSCRMPLLIHQPNTRQSLQRRHVDATTEW